MNIITHNISAMFTARYLGINTDSKAKSIEKLSSGYRINRSADDAAGLSISEKMRRQIRGLKQGAENMQDGVSFCQTADGYLEEVTSMLQRMNELSIKAANGTNSESDRADIDNEIQELKEETARIFSTAKFNETYIFRVPYVPAPAIYNDDIQVFSSGLNGDGSIKYGGIEINDVRHTWEELGLDVSSDGKTFTSDKTVHFNDYTGEYVELIVKAGDSVSDITRRNYWSADDNGVIINDIHAQTWNEIGIKSSGNTGEYSVKFKGQEIFFEVNDGDTLEDVISNISGKTLNSKYSWDLSTSKSGDNISKALDIISVNNGNPIRITQNNKNNIDPSITYGISVYGADDNGGITLISSDGVSHTSTQWKQILYNPTSPQYPISDWGLTDIDGQGLRSNLKTFDDSAVYSYTNTANPDLNISFAFKLSDEAGLAEAKNAIDGVAFNQNVSAPNTVSSSSSNGSLGGNRPSARLSTSTLGYVEQKAYGRNFDNASATLTGIVNRTFTDGSLNSSSTSAPYSVNITGDTSPSSSSSSEVYLKIGEKYYLRDKNTDIYSINTEWMTTTTDNYQNANYKYSGSFANVNISDVSQNFDYTKETRTKHDQASTRTHVYYTEKAGSETGYDADELDAIFGAGGWTAEDTDNSSDTTVNTGSEGTSTVSTNYYSNASSTINIPSAISGNPGFNLTVSDSTNTLGNSSISINFNASGFATWRLSTDERNITAGNINDHVEMRKIKVNVPPKELPIQATATNPDYIALRWNGLNNAIIGIKATNTRTVSGARHAIDEVSDAIKLVSDTRSTFGAQQNRLEHSIKQNNNTAENTQAAESLIRDTDMAKEMVKYSKEQILEQVGQAMLTQANQQPLGVLSLLQ